MKKNPKITFGEVESNGDYHGVNANFIDMREITIYADGKNIGKIEFCHEDQHSRIDDIWSFIIYKHKSDLGETYSLANLNAPYNTFDQFLPIVEEMARKFVKKLAATAK